MMNPKQLDLFIRLPEVMQRVGLSKSQVYKLIAEDQFPNPVKVSQRISCWVVTEVDDWIKNQIQCRDSELEHG